MRTLFCRRVGLGLSLLIGLCPLLVGAGPKPAVPKLAGPKLAAYQGKVVPLADVLAKAGVRLDADAGRHWLALVAEDGKIYPLVKDDGARLFFKDKALRNRPMRLMGRLIPGSQLLRVSAVYSIHKGALYEVYYWCDICTIKRGEKNICECCGGPMELREEPFKK
jgi:hypothetical protein